MSTDHRAALRHIRTFPALVRYLRDEMDWPIDSDDFEDLTFDETPEDLGIDPRNAAKIEEIKRLRPFTNNQPWGIFFVNFEPRRLPVVALRRILSGVALKKRASANSAERPAWQIDDLLFISNYGEGDQRQISFAHFAQASGKNDLPTLKVLGWDDRDTALHLDAVADTLTRQLAWPQNASNLDAWRDQWRGAFTLGHREVITTSQALSVRLAALARTIRDRIQSALAIETERGPYQRLLKAFQQALIHDLDADGFADMYAQTIAYGLLAARVENPKAQTADALPAQMPVTNPFLKELMETFLQVGGRQGQAGGPGLDFDELGISEVVELLDAANMEAVVRDFGDKNREEDPVIHFYEVFLKEYDAKKRMQRGVFYTPHPVVSYIVRSVHELLQTEFGLEDGLASIETWGDMQQKQPDLKIPEGVTAGSPFVQILDPATGTATFLVEVIEVIHRTLTVKWQQQGWNEKRQQAEWNAYVPEHLLPRLYGYELMMAPYAIAHMKIGLKLRETGYRFEREERVRVYLTNALEPASDVQGRLEGMAPALAHEAQAANKIKREKRFTVLIGNPPYSGHSANTGEWIANLMRGTSGFNKKTSNYFMVNGESLNERNPKWLNDDYVKFIRFAHWQIDSTGCGFLAFITNHSYLENPTFRGMRHSLMESFNKAYLLDLHGNSKKKEQAPDGSADQNVFEIQQGVSVNLFVKKKVKQDCSVYNADLYGEQDKKYQWLLRNDAASTQWQSLSPQASFYLFTPQDMSLLDEYEKGWKINEIMPVNSVGIVTARDDLTIHWKKEDIWETVCDFVSLPPENARYKYNLGNDARDWKVELAQQDLKAGKGLSKDKIVPITYRPFDIRYTYYTGKSRGFICMPRPEVMQHLLKENLGLVTVRQQSQQSQSWCLIGVTRQLIEGCIISNKTKEINYLFPLRIYDITKKSLFGSIEKNKPEKYQSNFAPGFISRLKNMLGLNYISSGKSNLETSFCPENVFHYIYAVFHSPEYRDRYANFLKIDFPRLPLTSSLDLFRALSKLGGDLVALYLMESPKLDQHLTTFEGSTNPVVEKISWAKNTVWIDKKQTRGFQGVPEEVWNFHIGSYQVCEKWLKDRKGRTLTADDINHYHRIVVALSETIRLMTEIDEVIDEHGGWPGAFSS